MAGEQRTPSEHDAIEDFIGDAQTEGPPGDDDFNISVSIPRQMEVKLVDASTLSDYELFFFLASVSSSAFFGFGIAWWQEREVKASNILLFVTGIFCLMFVAFVAIALAKRRRMKAESRTIPLRRRERNPSQ